jgi:hypothetical protein
VNFSANVRVGAGVLGKLGDGENEQSHIESVVSIPKREAMIKVFWAGAFYFFSKASSLLFTSSQFTIFQKASTNLALSFL